MVTTTRMSHRGLVIGERCVLFKMQTDRKTQLNSSACASESDLHQVREKRRLSRGCFRFCNALKLEQQLLKVLGQIADHAAIA
jgi:hypothetical protein